MLVQQSFHVIFVFTIVFSIVALYKLFVSPFMELLVVGAKLLFVGNLVHLRLRLSEWEMIDQIGVLEDRLLVVFNIF